MCRQAKERGTDICSDVIKRGGLAAHTHTHTHRSDRRGCDVQAGRQKEGGRIYAQTSSNGGGVAARADRRGCNVQAGKIGGKYTHRSCSRREEGNASASQQEGVQRADKQ